MFRKAAPRRPSSQKIGSYIVTVVDIVHVHTLGTLGAALKKQVINSSHGLLLLY